MKAFAEELPPGSMLIRVGQDTDAFGKDYEFVLILTTDGELKGLSGSKGFTVSHMRALKRLVEGELGREWKFRRLNHQNERTVTMAKEKIANVSEIFSGGKLNHGRVMSSFVHAMKQVSDGHYEIKNGKASQTDIPGGVHVVVEFDRMEK